MFDIHRDAGFTSKKPTTTMINGKSAARIMLVIGGNHENWQENLAFARQLETKCNELYPGLLRDLKSTDALHFIPKKIYTERELGLITTC